MLDATMDPDHRLLEATIANATKDDNDDAILHENNTVQSFPIKLHLLLEGSENRNSRVVSWLPDGLSFRIHQKENFTRLILPEYFHHCTYASFEHNLSSWGFKFVSKGPMEGTWVHPLFRRGKPQLCQRMHRTTRAPPYGKRPRDKSPLGPSELAACSDKMDILSDGLHPVTHSSRHQEP